MHQHRAEACALWGPEHGTQTELKGSPSRLAAPSPFPLLDVPVDIVGCRWMSLDVTGCFRSLDALGKRRIQLCRNSYTSIASNDELR